LFPETPPFLDTGPSNTRQYTDGCARLRGRALLETGGICGEKVLEPGDAREGGASALRVEC
jgi:hypothetical protein